MRQINQLFKNITLTITESGLPEFRFFDKIETAL